MKAVITTAALVACLFTVAPKCLSEEDIAATKSELPSSVWSVQRIGEPVPEGISEYTYGLALSTDRQWIATLGDRLRIWDVSSGKPIGEPINIVGQTVAWSPDGTTVIAGTLDGRLVLSNAGTSRILWQTAIGNKAITALAFSPDGHFLAASNRGDKTIRILNAAGKELCQGASGHREEVTALTFAEGGKTVVSASMDSTIRTWDAASCKELRQPIESKNGFFRLLTLHPGGTVVAVAAREGPTVNDRNGGIEFWDVKSGQAAAAPLKGYGGTYGIGGLAFSEDGSKLMVADSSGSLGLIDWKTGQLLARGITNHDATIVWRTIFSPKGDFVATAGKDRVLGIWLARVTPVSASPLALTSQKIYTLDGAVPTFTDNGKLVAFTRDNQVVVHETDSGKVMLEAPLKNRAYGLAMSPDGQWLVAFDGRIHLWRIPTKRSIGEWDYWGSEAFAFSPTNTRLAIGASSRIFLIDCISGKEIARYQIGTDPHNPRVLRLVFDPTGRILLASTGEGDVYRLDASTLQSVGDPWRGLSSRGALVFSADGSRVAVGRRLAFGESTQVIVLDAVSGAQLADPMEENMGWEQTLAFTADGNHLLMAGGNGSVSLWDSVNDQRLAHITSGSRAPLRGIRFTRDLQRLYACDMGTYTRTDCMSWTVAFHVPSASSTHGRPSTALTPLSPIGDTSLVIGSLSNAIDFRTNELVVRPGKEPFLLLNAGVAQLLGTIESSGKGGQYTATVYTDSALSADRSLVTVPMNDGQLTIFNINTGKLLNVMDAEGTHTFLSDGSLAFDQGEKGILIVDPKSGNKLRTVTYPMQGNVSVLAAGSIHPTIIVGTTEGTLLLGRTDSSAAHFKVLKNMHRGGIFTVALSPDERLVASGGADGSIQLFDLHTGNPLGAPWMAHGKAVTAIGFNSEDSLLASGSADGTIRVWNVRTGQAVTNALVAHTEPVLAVAFDSTNGRILSFGRDYHLRSWALSQIPGKRDGH